MSELFKERNGYLILQFFFFVSLLLATPCIINLGKYNGKQLLLIIFDKHPGDTSVNIKQALSQVK